MPRSLPLWLVGLVLLAGSLPGFSQEWTRFRGPNGNGQNDSANIPAQWQEDDFAWKVELPGVGHGSPVLWGNKLFVLSADPKTATRYFLCFDAHTGKQMWRAEYPGVPHHLHARSSFASCTPCVEQDRAYVAWSDPDHTRLLAFDHAGNELWSQDFGPWVSQHGFGTSPIIYDDLVIVTCSQEPSKQPNTPEPKASFVVAVDKKNGQIRWRTERGIDTTSYSVPCIRKNEAGQEEIVCCSTVEGIFALDPKTGKEIWALPVFDKRTVSSPQLIGDLVLGTTGSGGGGNYLTALRPGPDPKVAYEVRRQAPYVPTPVARENLLFLFEDKSGFVTCIHADSGEEVWQERLNLPFSGSPVRAGDKLFCVAEDGTVVCLAAADEFKELGRTPLGEECRSTPAIANGKMYVRTISHLYCVGGK
jgi:outer membrane protein assembly factor BamB